MSLTEMTQRGEEFERMPPHDVAAEQCVLGGMLLSKDAISDVIEVIRPSDHYRPAHQLVHEAILDLYARGEPADAITVSNELTRRGELARIGGAPYLHTLIASVPTAANAGYYARIVRERAILRRLVEAGTRIVQFGYAGDADADDLVDRAQAEVYAVTDRRIAEDYHPLSEIMPAALEEIEAIGAHGGGISGVPTGFADLDSLTNGLHPGQMIVVAARPAVGKALALDTPLPTPDGWTTMGEVGVGDYLIDADGKPTRVVAATGVLHGRPCYEVEFSDGSVIIADENHQWQTWTRPDALARPHVVTTGEIAGSLPRHAIALTHTADLPAGAPRDTRWRFITDVRPVFPRPVRCVQVDNEDELYLAGRGMIPTHNSALALDFARSATIRHGLPTVVFSLEMGRNEITMRLLSAEARVPMHIMRTGQMSDDDWGRLAKRMSEVADAPLFIDDSPNMSLMEIRAKCRRLKQRHDLKLVIIDYLQLMSSPKKTESRQQEVSEMSRSLKLLAKELQVPVVALSQLNRGPEQRQDKKPMLSDLRESGCLTGDTTVCGRTPATPVTFDELMRNGWNDVLVWSLDDRHQLVPAPVTNVFESGTKEVFRLRLASGREVKATANHPFLTFSGWTPLGELGAGDRLAIPRRIPAPMRPASAGPSTGSGSSRTSSAMAASSRSSPCTTRRTTRRTWSSSRPRPLPSSASTPRRVAQQTWWHVYLPAPVHCTHGRGNPIHDWFRELGIEYRGAHDKRLPNALFRGQRRRDLPLPEAPVGNGRLRLAAARKLRGEGVLRVFEPGARRRGCAPAGQAGDSRAHPAGGEGRIRARLPRDRGRRAEPAYLLRAGRRAWQARRDRPGTGRPAGRPHYEHQRGHSAAWRMGPGQVGASAGRAHRAPVPGRYRDELLRHDALQELPVARTAHAMRGCAGL